MIVKQKNLRVFHISIDDEEVFFAYFTKNKVLLLEFFLLIDGQISKTITDFLDEQGACYKYIDTCSIKFGTIKSEIKAPVDAAVKKKEVQKTLDFPSQKMQVFDRPIRSGEEIRSQDPVVVFGRINSGAKLFCEQNLTIYGIIDGLVQCDGRYMVLQGIGRHGNLIFNGEIIDKESLRDTVLQKLEFDGKKVNIKEVCL